MYNRAVAGIGGGRIIIFFSMFRPSRQRDYQNDFPVNLVTSTQPTLVTVGRTAGLDNNFDLSSSVNYCALGLKWIYAKRDANFE